MEYEAPPSEPPQAQLPRKRKILFIGDSLITGVGCSPERDLGPALPRSVAEFVSRHLRQDVEWTALGHTGGNVREIGISQVPRMQAEIARAEAQGECFDAVVVVVGLNDFKRAYRSAQFTAGSFRSELAELVTTIQSAAGKQCTVVLPALPVQRGAPSWGSSSRLADARLICYFPLATHFPGPRVGTAPVFGGMWPLQPFLETLAGLWDEQKRALAQGVRRVSFVNHAEGDEWWAADRYWAADGIHPNDEGYRVWGEHIAQAVTQCLRNGSPAHAVTQRST